MRTADDDRDVEVLLDLDRELLDRMVHAGQRGKRDQPGIVFADGADEIGRVRDEQQLCVVAVGFEDPGEIGDADGLLDAVVLDEERFHVARPR